MKLGKKYKKIHNFWNIGIWNKMLTNFLILKSSYNKIQNTICNGVWCNTLCTKLLLNPFMWLRLKLKFEISICHLGNLHFEIKEQLLNVMARRHISTSLKFSSNFCSMPSFISRITSICRSYNNFYFWTNKYTLPFKIIGSPVIPAIVKVSSFS